MNKIRNYFVSEGFLEIETPVLFKSTSEGAREFLVPTREHGMFYSLTQSPQQYKQLLMVGGVDRYFQIAKCFRDEDLFTNRQAEFTQVDVEMSFVGVDDILAVSEKMIRNITNVALPIRRMTYETSIKLYGDDKPDLRFGFSVHDISDLCESTNGMIVEAIKLPRFFSAEIPHPYIKPKNLKIMKQSIWPYLKPYQKELKHPIVCGVWNDLFLSMQEPPPIELASIFKEYETLNDFKERLDLTDEDLYVINYRKVDDIQVN
jgi:aspartyl-tRNA synthetase